MGDGGGEHWLVRMEWRPAGWSVCLPLLIFPCTVKSRSSLLAPTHPGGPGKRAVKRLWCFHLPRSTASSLFRLRAWQSFCTTSFHVLCGLLLGLKPSTSYSVHFFTQSVSSFRSTCHTIATCFAVVSILYHLFLVFLLTPYLELCLLP